MNDESSRSEISAELEARVVALLLGEASDFERDELERLIEERTDVRNFRDQMQSVYGLLEHAAGDAPLGVGGGSASDENCTDGLGAEWKLSEEKRSAVLALFAGQEVTEKVSASDADAADDSLAEHAAHGAEFSSDIVVQKQSLAEGHSSKSTVEVVQKRAFRLLLENRAWVTAASLLLLFGCAGFWFYPNLQYVVSDTRIALDSRLMDEAPTAESPMTARPSDSASGGVRARFGLSAPASGAKMEATRQGEMLDREMAQSKLLQDKMRVELNAEMDMDMEADMGGLVLGMDIRRDSRGVTDDMGSLGWRDTANSHRDQSLKESEEQEEEVEPQLSASTMPSSGVVMPGSQSAATPEATASPDGTPYLSGKELLNRGIPNSVVRGQAAQQNQPAIVDQDRNGVADGFFYSGQNQMGGGGMGGGAGMEMGRDGIVANSRQGRDLAKGKTLDLNDRFGSKQQQRQQQEQRKAVGQVFEKSGSRDGADRAFAAAELFDDSASDTKEKSKASGTLAPFTEVPIPRQPSAPVNGPGLVDSIDVSGSAGENLLNYSKRVSGFNSNFSGGEQAAAEVGSGNDDLALGSIARSEAEIAKDVSEKETIKEPAKKRKLAILGGRMERQVSVPSGFPEIDASTNGFSTFSLHVSDVSFKLAQAALSKGEWPDASRIRSEEFLNAFDYGDPMPTQNERVSCRIEQSIHPFLQQRNLLRVAMRTAAAGRSSSTPLRLTFLLDNSGSMERVDRQQTVRRAFAVLAQQLKPIDEVTLISFARQPRLLADRISGAAAASLLQTIENLPSEGGTNLEAALGLAFEKAQEQYQENAQNRIILLTDGAVNLGDARPERLANMIVMMRNDGIAFDAAGISADGLNDEVLEALTRKGDGRYYLLDSLESVEDGFAEQIAGALRPAAKNVKIQVEFNPERVGKYKLLGFEKHRLKKEDFRNDKVDAAEMAAAEAGVALYQVQTKPDGHGDVGTISVRFRDLETGQMVEEIWPIPYETSVPRSDLASSSMKIATAASLLATKLKGGAMADTVDLKELASLLASLPPQIRNNQRIRKLEVMIQQTRQINGN
jgi:Mg-chelatase subunit ChlD